MTGTLDSDGQLTLMLGAGAGGTAGQDLAALGQIATQLGGILKIDVINLVYAEASGYPHQARSKFRLVGCGYPRCEHYG